MTTVACTLILLVQQGSPQDLQRHVAELEQQIRELTAELDNQRQLNRAIQGFSDDAEGQLARMAQEIFRLRQMVDEGAPPPGSQAADEGTTPATHPGPTASVRAEVLVVSRENPVVVLDVGEAHGVMPGYRFEIVRDDRRVAIVEVEQTITQDGTKSRCRVVEGRVRDILVGDRAIAFVAGGAPGVVPAGAPAAPVGPTARVTGSVNDGYVVNLGRQDNVSPGDLFHIYRGGVKRATLRVEYVDADWCIAKPAAGYAAEPVLEGDEVQRREMPRLVVGRILAVRPQEGIFIGVGASSGAFPGQRFQVSRLGRTVGAIQVTDAREFYSICRACEGTDAGTLQAEDFVEPARE